MGLDHLICQEEARALKKQKEEEAKARKKEADDAERALFIVNAERAKLGGVEVSAEKRRELEACLLREEVWLEGRVIEWRGTYGFIG